MITQTWFDGVRLALAVGLMGAGFGPGLNAEAVRAPSAHEQLPRAMHGTMVDRPRVTVGLRDADLVGADQRVLQAAVDYVAGLGAGTV